MYQLLAVVYGTQRLLTQIGTVSLLQIVNKINAFILLGGFIYCQTVFNEVYVVSNSPLNNSSTIFPST